MLSPTFDHAAPSSPFERPEAVQAQIEEARAVLRADAWAAGSDPALVDEALAAAADRYAGAHVHAFIGILVERDVRERLCLRRADGERLSVSGD